MAWLEPFPSNVADSTAFQISPDTYVADPFDPSNLTWTEVIASTPENFAGFHLNYLSLNDRYGIFFVGIGAAGSEVITSSTPIRIGNRFSFSFAIPIAISAGSRVAVAHIANSSTSTVMGQIAGIPSSGVAQDPPYTVMESGPYDLSGGFSGYGRAVTVDPGSTANSKGVWTEISSADAANVINGDSLANDYEWLGLMFSDDDQRAAGQDRLWDISTGAAGAESGSVTISNLYDHYQWEVGILEAAIQWTGASISAGTRISARMQSSTTDAASRVGSVLLFGLR